MSTLPDTKNVALEAKDASAPTTVPPTIEQALWYLFHFHFRESFACTPKVLKSLYPVY